jgi:hypothetical protein
MSEIASLFVPGVLVALGAIWLANLWFAEPHYSFRSLFGRKA